MSSASGGQACHKCNLTFSRGSISFASSWSIAHNKQEYTWPPTDQNWLSQTITLLLHVDLMSAPVKALLGCLVTFYVHSSILSLSFQFRRRRLREKPCPRPGSSVGVGDEVVQCGVVIWNGRGVIRNAVLVVPGSA